MLTLVVMIPESYVLYLYIQSIWVKFASFRPASTVSVPSFLTFSLLFYLLVAKSISSNIASFMIHTFFFFFFSVCVEGGM